MEDLTNYLLKKAFPLFFFYCLIHGGDKKAEGTIFNVSSKKQWFRLEPDTYLRMPVLIITVISTGRGG